MPPVRTPNRRPRSPAKWPPCPSGLGWLGKSGPGPPSRKGPPHALLNAVGWPKMAHREGVPGRGLEIAIFWVSFAGVFHPALFLPGGRGRKAVLPSCLTFAGGFPPSAEARPSAKPPHPARRWDPGSKPGTQASKRTCQHLCHDHASLSRGQRPKGRPLFLFLLPSASSAFLPSFIQATCKINKTLNAEGLGWATGG